MTNKIRFWTYHGPAGHPVQIKLRAGQRLTHHHERPTDEGWHSETQTWSFDGERLTTQFVTDGADCDGRLSTYSEAVCEKDQLRAGTEDPDFGVRYPAWQRVDASQRDYSAEAMGY